MNLKNMFFALIMGVLLSCNKYSNELPPVNIPPTPPSPDSLVQLAHFDNQELLKITYRYYKTGVQDSVVIRLVNLVSADRETISVLLEFCNKLPMNFDNCREVRYFRNINFISDTTIKFLVSNNFTLSDSLLKPYVIRYGENNHFLSGVYNNINAYAQIFSDTTTGNTTFGYLKGFVQADGKGMFKMKFSDTAYYNIQGVFIPGTQFSGYIDKNGIRGPNVVLDSFMLGEEKVLYDTSNGQLRLRCRITDTFYPVQFIDLFLK